MYDQKWPKYTKNILSGPLTCEYTYSSCYGRISNKNLVLLFVYAMFELVTVGIRLFMNFLVLLCQLIFGLGRFLADYYSNKRFNTLNWKPGFVFLGGFIIFSILFFSKGMWLMLLWEHPIMPCEPAEYRHYYDWFCSNDYPFRSNTEQQPEDDNFGNLINVTKPHDYYSFKKFDRFHIPRRPNIHTKTVQTQTPSIKIRFKNLQEEVIYYLAVEKTFTFTLMDELKNVLYETSAKFNVSVLETQPLLVKVPIIVLQDYD